MIQILGGLAKGLLLTAPPETLTRPTAVGLRRRLFDAHQSLSGHLFVDLFAGSGTMAIEAWSRGALAAVVVEPDPRVRKVLTKNLQALAARQGMSEALTERPIELFAQNAQSWLARFFTHPDAFISSDCSSLIIYIDPPYENHRLYHEVITLILEQAPRLQRARITLWVESDQQKGMALAPLARLVANEKGFDKHYTHGSKFVGIQHLS